MHISYEYYVPRSSLSDPQIIIQLHNIMCSWRFVLCGQRGGCPHLIIPNHLVGNHADIIMIMEPYPVHGDYITILAICIRLHRAWTFRIELFWKWPTFGDLIRHMTSQPRISRSRNGRVHCWRGRRYFMYKMTRGGILEVWFSDGAWET